MATDDINAYGFAAGRFNYGLPILARAQSWRTQTKTMQ
jgi:hypothetical protein